MFTVIMPFMGDTVLIREIRESDNPFLAGMIRHIFEEHDAPRCGTVYSDHATDDLFNLFRAYHSVLYVAEVNGTIAGCCGIYPTKGLGEECVELVKFYLSADARGKGIGRSLMERSINSARDFGFRYMYIESLPQFSNAVRIYTKLGFRMLDKPLGSSGHNSCNIWMLKEL